MDEVKTKPDHLWKMMTKHWGFEQPNLVISLTGGDIDLLKRTPQLYQKLKHGLMETAIKESTSHNTNSNN